MTIATILHAIIDENGDEICPLCKIRISAMPIGAVGPHCEHGRWSTGPCSKVHNGKKLHYAYVTTSKLICVICNKPIERNDKVRRWKSSPDDDYGSIVHAECCKLQPTQVPHQEHPANHGRRTTQEYMSSRGL